MSNIAMTINDAGSARNQIVAILRKHFQLNLSHILKAIDERRVVLEQPLFPRLDPAFPERLLTAMEALDKLPVSYEVFELLDHQTFDKMNRNSLYQITTERLKNIIEADKELQKWIRKQIDLEEGFDELTDE